ncbi:MAG TPA: endonuclease III [Bacillota bacterium]|nr:endonuclease III [Bacillota bacterium]
MIKRWQNVFKILRDMYPHARCELDYVTPFELLIATILSAQCTDQRVNMITPQLFARFRRPEDYLSVSQEELEGLIRTCGLYRNKARSILLCSQALVHGFGGEVPRDMASLQSLPGVGRKTAAVVASNAFGIPALAVDTHVFRVARRIGMSRGGTPERVEADVCAIYPQEKWIDLHHLLIWHGRRLCHARNPRCTECPLQTFCDRGRRVPGEEVPN